jgi:hypothetical protein
MASGHTALPPTLGSPNPCNNPTQGKKINTGWKRLLGYHPPGFISTISKGYFPAAFLYNETMGFT